MTELTLESLPVEILSQIFIDTGSLTAARFLARASLRFSQVFRENQLHILEHIMRPTMHPLVWKVAVRTAEARKLRGVRRNKNAIHQFCQTLDDDVGPLDRDTLISIYRFLPTVELFVRVYSRTRAVWLLDSYTQLFRPSILQGPHTLVTLSGVEKGRLQRAFYRLELFGRIFNEGPHSRGNYSVAGSGQFSPEQQASMFLKNIPPWEIEELACVRDYLLQQLIRVFKRVENRFVGRWMAQFPHENSDQDVVPLDEMDEMEADESETDLDDYQAANLPWEYFPFFNIVNKRNHPQYMDYIITLGLDFILTLLVEPTEQLVVMNCKIERNIRQALQIPLTAWRVLHSYDQMPTSPAIDALETNNEGWYWAGVVNPSRSWNRTERLEMRHIGYVFWDRKRLEDSGLLALE